MSNFQYTEELVNGVLIKTSSRFTENFSIAGSKFKSITSGNRNIACGANSLRNTTTGNDNLAIGYNSGVTNTTGSNNISIGNNSDTENGNYRVAIGNNSICPIDNAIYLGNSNYTNLILDNAMITTSSDQEGGVYTRIENGISNLCIVNSNNLLGEVTIPHSITRPIKESGNFTTKFKKLISPSMLFGSNQLTIWDEKDGKYPGEDIATNNQAFVANDSIEDNNLAYGGKTFFTNDPAKTRQEPSIIYVQIPIPYGSRVTGFNINVLDIRQSPASLFQNCKITSQLVSIGTSKQDLIVLSNPNTTIAFDETLYPEQRYHDDDNEFPILVLKIEFLQEQNTTYIDNETGIEYPYMHHIFAVFKGGWVEFEKIN